MITKHTIDSAFDSIAVTQSTSPWVVGDGGGSLTVDASDLDIRDLTHVTDSVKVGDGTDFLAIAADGSIAVTDNGGSLTVDGTVELGATTLAALENITVDAVTGTVTVQATNLDIRDLTHVSDSVKIGDGTDFLAVAADGSIAITDNGGSLTVDGTVAVTQSTSPWVVSGTVTAAPDAYDSWLVTADAAVAASPTVTQVLASALTNRLKVKIQNIGGNDVRMGNDNTVSSSKGTLIKRGTSEEIELGAGAAIYLIGVGGASTVTLSEYAS